MSNERETRYAEAIIESDIEIYPRTVGAWTDTAHAVMAVADAEIAAQVEAAVSVVRAEVEREQGRRMALHSLIAFACADLGWATDGTDEAIKRHVEEVVRRWRAAESERDALREKVAKVEALRDEAQGLTETYRNCDHTYDLHARLWGNVADQIDRALSDPTTPDQKGGES